MLPGCLTQPGCARSCIERRGRGLEGISAAEPPLRSVNLPANVTQMRGVPEAFSEKSA